MLQEISIMCSIHFFNVVFSKCFLLSCSYYYGPLKALTHWLFPPRPHSFFIEQSNCLTYRRTGVASAAAKSQRLYSKLGSSVFAAVVLADLDVGFLFLIERLESNILKLVDQANGFFSGTYCGLIYIYICLVHLQLDVAVWTRHLDVLQVTFSFKSTFCSEN